MGISYMFENMKNTTWKNGKLRIRAEHWQVHHHDFDNLSIMTSKSSNIKWYFGGPCCRRYGDISIDLDVPWIRTFSSSALWWGFMQFSPCKFRPITVEWMFPEMGVPLNYPFSWDFPLQPLKGVAPWLWNPLEIGTCSKTPIRSCQIAYSKRMRPDRWNRLCEASGKDMEKTLGVLFQRKPPKKKQWTITIIIWINHL